MPADLSVLICSFNGGVGVDRCLSALVGQTIRSRLEIIVVDDGSSDATSDVARRHGVCLFRHPVNRGLAAARNSGVQAATTPVVAFLDDDCEPEPKWAEKLLAHYQEAIAGVGGPVLVSASPGFMRGYLQRNNPLRPLELDLAKSGKLPYRLYLYLKRLWRSTERSEERDVYSFAGANMSFRRQVLLDAGCFDERFSFGAEELDLCLRLARTFPAARLVFSPEVRVVHHFEASLRDTLRRSRSYGRGSARLYRKWPEVRPTVFPGPLLVLVLLILAIRFPLLGAVALAVPPVMYPRGWRTAVARRDACSLLDPYVQLAQEAYENVGFAEGLWRFRHLVPESGPETAGKVRSQRRPEHVQ